MALGTTWRLAGFLRQLARAEAVRGPDPAVEECLDLSAGEGRYDLYRPRGETRAAVVVCHGGNRHGRRHGRLVHFARSLARCQVACAVPELPALADCRFERSDQDALARVIFAARERMGLRPGLAGFSFGGSYALRVAALPEVAGAVRFVLTVGAFHSLSSLFDWVQSDRRKAPETEAEWDDEIYLRLVVAWWLRGQGALAPEACAEAGSLFDRFCEEASSLEKRTFYARHLRGSDLFARARSALDPALLGDLSPAGNLAGLRCPVTLVHDRKDSLVPPEQAQALFAELRRLPTAADHRLLLTTILSHVSFVEAVNVIGLMRLGSAASVLLRDD